MVPVLKSNMLVAANQAQDIMDKHTQCYKIANDLDIVQTSLCVSVEYALDAFWLGFLVMALTGTFSMAFFIGVANGLASRTAKKSLQEEVAENKEEKIKMPEPDGLADLLP
jgi:hypothetical protein